MSKEIKFYNNYTGKNESIYVFLDNALSDSYSSGSLERIEGESNNVKNSYIKLIEVLSEKGILNKEDIERLAGY